MKTVKVGFTRNTSPTMKVLLIKEYVDGTWACFRLQEITGLDGTIQQVTNGELRIFDVYGIHEEQI